MTPIAWCAAVLGVAGWWPQIQRTWRTRSAAGLVWALIVGQSLSVALWLTYGVRVADTALMAMQTANTVVLLGLAAVKGRADRRVPWYVIAYAVAVVPTLVGASYVVPPDAMGYAGGLLGIGSWVAQLVKLAGGRNAADLSPWMLLILFGAAWGFGVSGYLTGQTPLVTTQAIVCLQLAVALALLVHHARRAADVSEPRREP